MHFARTLEAGHSVEAGGFVRKRRGCNSTKWLSSRQSCCALLSEEWGVLPREAVSLTALGQAALPWFFSPFNKSVVESHLRDFE